MRGMKEVEAVAGPSHRGKSIKPSRRCSDASEHTFSEKQKLRFRLPEKVDVFDKEEEESEMSDMEEEEEEELDLDSTSEETNYEESSEIIQPRIRTNKEAQHGLGQNRVDPTKVQLAARNGISRKLPKFTGKPEEWPLFIGSYEASNEACGYSDVENLVRLQESLQGAALESVRGRLLLPKSVPHVITKLRQLYGRPEQLLQCHLEKLKKLDSPKADKLATFIPFGNAIEQLCEHLEAAGLTQHLANPLLIQELVDKLPANDKREWVRYKRRKKLIDLRAFTNFVAQIVSEACEANVNLDFKANEVVQAGRGRSGERRALYNHSVQERSVDPTPRQKPCKVCRRTDHRLRFCQDFKRLVFSERMEIVDRWKLCKVCLNDHGNAPCKFQIRCNVEDCRERHHTLLHPPTQNVSINAHIRVNTTVLFRVLPVKLFNGESSIRTLAFLDEGASVTLIEQSLIDRLGIVGVKERLEISWTSDITRVEKDSQRMDLWITGDYPDEKLVLNNVRSVKELLLPKQSLNAEELSGQYKHLRGLHISSYCGERPGLLIGLNNLHTIAPMDARIGKPGDPIAVRSKLGWSVYGPKKGLITCSENYVGHHMVSNQDLHELLRTHYAIEESVTTVLKESHEEKRARDILHRTTVRIGDRFETGLLWRNDNPQFPESRAMAFQRLKQLERRLEKNPVLYDNVRMQIEQYLQKGYAHIASVEELNETDPQKTWYLPINVVLNPKKPNKVRLVWDAAASVDGVSLNSQLLSGPDMLTSLPAVISRFREWRIAFGADIREMYHQIRIRDADKQAQRFLFRSSANDSPKIYVMDVATFGSTCSPCSAQFVKNQNALEFASKYPDAAAAIIHQHYVDDYFDSVDDECEAERRAKEVKYIHSKTGFDIVNWVSNSNDILHNMGEREDGQLVHLNLNKETENERVLGIIWNPGSDVFSFSTEHREDLKQYLNGSIKPTKRVILSCVMGFFDPLGLLSPFTVHGRMLVQDLWRSGCEWDDEISGDCMVKWERWTGRIQEVEAVRIPRCHLRNVHSSTVDSIELHIFTDASELAYGSVAYFRVVRKQDVFCSLVMSRSKVAPLKRQSVPRLELMAAVLGARISQTIKTNHTLSISRCICWTDSRTVLSWIRSDQHNYKQFVAFRIGEILDTTKLTDWRWIPSNLNIADVLTKWGQKGPPLESNGPWFRGPDFLYESEISWPKQTTPATNTKEEMKATVLIHDRTLSESVINVHRTSSWHRLLRITATVLRFIANCRRKIAGIPIITTEATERQQEQLKSSWKTVQQTLQQDELLKAELTLWKQAQRESFPDEIAALTSNIVHKPNGKIYGIEKASVLYKLTPILDTEGVMRMGGRMQNCEVASFDMKYPIILDRGHEVTKKLVQYYHEKFGHGNRETVFNEIHKSFAY